MTQKILDESQNSKNPFAFFNSIYFKTIFTMDGNNFIDESNLIKDIYEGNASWYLRILLLMDFGRLSLQSLSWFLFIRFEYGKFRK